MSPSGLLHLSPTLVQASHLLGSPCLHPFPVPSHAPLRGVGSRHFLLKTDPLPPTKLKIKCKLPTTWPTGSGPARLHSFASAVPSTRSSLPSAGSPPGLILLVLRTQLQCHVFPKHRAKVAPPLPWGSPVSPSRSLLHPSPCSVLPDG